MNRARVSELEQCVWLVYIVRDSVRAAGRDGSSLHRGTVLIICLSLSRLTVEYVWTPMISVNFGLFLWIVTVTVVLLFCS
jgi:hypothetical protein